MKIDLIKLRQIASEPSSRAELWDRVLRQLAGDFSADMAVAWDCRRSPFRSVARHAPRGVTAVGMSHRQHEDLLTQAVTTGELILARTRTESPASVEANSSATPSPEAHGGQPCVILIPVLDAQVHLIELVVHAAADIDRSGPWVAEVKEACRVLACGLEKADSPAPAPLLTQPGSARSDRPNALSANSLSRYVATIHESIEIDLTAERIANEARRLVDCDRVSVAVRHRGRFRITAVSGQSEVNPRSNTIKSLELLARRCLDSETTLWFPSDASALAPKIDHALTAYLDQSSARSLVVLPVYENATREIEDPQSDGPARNEVIGGIVYERHQDDWDESLDSPVLTMLNRHAAAALRNAVCHDQIFLGGLWKRLGRVWMLARPHVFARAIAGAAALVVLLMVLFLWRTPFYLPASGVLVPSQIRGVFPAVEGEMADLFVVHGQRVSEGEALARLSSGELELRIAENEGRLNALRRRAAEIESRSFDRIEPRANPSTESLNLIRTEIESLTKQNRILARMSNQLTLTAPITGTVITWDLEHKLLGRRVDPSQRLMQIADTTGPWEILLDIDERQCGKLLRALDATPTAALEVQLLFAADPGKTHSGRIIESAESMRISLEHERQLRVRVQIDHAGLDVKQIRSGVSAKIYCGYDTSIGYLWLHEIPSTIRRHVLFYLAS